MMETIKSRINQAIDYIKRGETKKAIDLAQLTLNSSASSELEELRDNIILFQARYSAFKKEKNEGTISHDQYTIEKNKLNRLALETIRDLENKAKNIPQLKLGLSITETKEEGKEPEVKIQKSPKAETAPRRTELIVQNLKVLIDSQYLGLVREKSNLSTFSIPNRDLDNPIWNHIKFRDDKEKTYTQMLSAQRYWLEKHALDQSCKLIVHLEDGLVHKSTEHGLYRLKTLLEFLITHRDRIDIVNVPRSWSENNEEGFENLLIVGHSKRLVYSFFAHSQSATSSEGITNTYISPESAEVAEQIQRFDAEFNSILEHLNLDIYQAKNQVIKWLEKKIRTSEL